jgi:hypothetical protein
MRKMVLKLFVLLALNVTSQAGATLMSISFDDGGNNVGSGVIDVENGYAISGDFFVTAGLASGDWALTGGTPSSVGSGVSPNGYFNYDNMVFLGSDPYLTTIGGLLFTNNLGYQLNIWADSPGVYSLWAANSGGGYIIEAGSYPGFSGATAFGTSTITNAPVTIASTTILPSRPTLSIQPTADGFMLQWPVSGSSFRLLQNADLNTTNWVANTNEVSVVGGTNQVTVSGTSGNLFFRLVNP